MNMESFGKSAYKKADERLEKVNQSLEGTSEEEEKEELTAEQASLKQHQQEIIDKSHDEALEEDATREQGKEQNTAPTEGDEINNRLAELAAEQSSLKQRQQEITNDTGSEKNVAQKQEVAPNAALEQDTARHQEQEVQKIAKVETKRVEAQQERETRDQERTQELKQKLNMIQETNTPEGKEKKMNRFEKDIEARKVEIQKKIEDLEKKSDLSQVFNRLVDDSDESIMQSDEELKSEAETLERDLEDLNSYVEMKKRPFWKHTFDKFFTKLDANDNPTANPIFGGAIGAGGAVMAATLPVAGVTVAFAPALVVGVGVGVALTVGVRTLGAIARAHNERKFAKENASVN